MNLSGTATTANATMSILGAVFGVTITLNMLTFVVERTLSTVRAHNYEQSSDYVTMMGLSLLTVRIRHVGAMSSFILFVGVFAVLISLFMFSIFTGWLSP